MSETWLSIACIGCGVSIARGFTGRIPVSLPLACNNCKAVHEYQTNEMIQMKK